tara:strand:- start:2142 stop:3227 length:1086 start_codon:yes stop_codon:yes gene_type:complete
MGIVTTLFFIVAVLLIFFVFRDKLFSEGKLSPLNIIISIIAIIVLWYFLKWVIDKYKSLNTLTKTADAREQQIIKADKLNDRNSNNFTISTWFYVNDWNYRYGSKKTLLKRGSSSTANPEIYFSENENNIVIKVNCYNSTDSTSTSSSGTGTGTESGTSNTGSLWPLTLDATTKESQCNTLCGDTNVYADDGNSIGTQPRPCNCECKRLGCANCDGTTLSCDYELDLATTLETTLTSPSTDIPNQHICEVKNFPLQKWVNLIVSVYGRTLDVYIDGKLVRTCVLPGVVKMTKGEDIYVTPNNGFHGFTSNIIYRPDASNPQEAYNIYSRGYGSAWLNSIFNRYKLKVSLLKDSRETGSFQV